MSYFVKSLLAVGCLWLAGCGDPVKLSGFVTPDASGNINADIENNIQSGQVTIGLEGVAWTSGSSENEGFKAFSGIIPGTEVAAAPTSGVVNYTGTYEVGGTGLITRLDGIILGASFVDSGAINLTGDFDAGTLTGTSGQLVVNGTITDTTVAGTVTYQGQNGTLAGLAGADQTFGVFHSNSDDLVYAGGFAAE